MPASDGQLTSLTTAKVFATSGGDVTVPDNAIGVLLQAETQNVRFRTSGTSPTASVGMILVAGDAPSALYGMEVIRALRVIEVAPSAKLNYAFLTA